MPSSISSSRATALFYTKVLLGICAVLIVLCEIASDYLLKYHSATYTRVSHQYAEAVKIRPAKPGEPIPVLMVGNSLLLEGVDVQRLQAMTSAKMRIYPIFLEATGYYDWFYGLQRLFREGSKPQVVVLGVGVNSFIANSVRQDYVPLMLFDFRDTFGAASDLKMDRTAMSNFVLAHSSVFWDTRSVLRTQILRQAVPHYRELVLLLKPLPAVPQAQLFEATANSRLEQLRLLCQAHGAKLILLVPPTPYSEDATREMSLASQKAGVEALVPIDPAALPTKYYQPDEMHLNSEGAALFTSALATFLPQKVNRETIVSPN
jgi:hypothetical protein